MLEQTSKSPGTKRPREKVDGIPGPPKCASHNYWLTASGKVSASLSKTAQITKLTASSRSSKWRGSDSIRLARIAPMLARGRLQPLRGGVFRRVQRNKEGCCTEKNSPVSENSDARLPKILRRFGHFSDCQRSPAQAHWICAVGKSGHVADRDSAALVSLGVAIAACEPAKTSSEAAFGRLRFSIAWNRPTVCRIFRRALWMYASLPHRIQ